MVAMGDCRLRTWDYEFYTDVLANRFEKPSRSLPCGGRGRPLNIKRCDIVLPSMMNGSVVGMGRGRVRRDDEPGVGSTVGNTCGKTGVDTLVGNVCGKTGKFRVITSVDEDENAEKFGNILETAVGTNNPDLGDREKGDTVKVDEDKGSKNGYLLKQLTPKKTVKSDDHSIDSKTDQSEHSATATTTETTTTTTTETTTTTTTTTTSKSPNSKKSKGKQKGSKVKKKKEKDTESAAVMKLSKSAKEGSVDNSKTHTIGKVSAAINNSENKQQKTEGHDISASFDISDTKSNNNDINDNNNDDNDNNNNNNNDNNNSDTSTDTSTITSTNDNNDNHNNIESNDDNNNNNNNNISKVDKEDPKDIEEQHEDENVDEEAEASVCVDSKIPLKTKNMTEEETQDSTATNTSCVAEEKQERDWIADLGVCDNNTLKDTTNTPKDSIKTPFKKEGKSIKAKPKTKDSVPLEEKKPYAPQKLEIHDVIINDNKRPKFSLDRHFNTKQNDENLINSNINKQLEISLSSRISDPTSVETTLRYNDPDFLKTLGEKERVVLIEHIPIESASELQDMVSDYGTIELFLTEFTNHEREQQALVKMGDESECDFVAACLDGYNWDTLRLKVQKVEDILAA